MTVVLVHETDRSPDSKLTPQHTPHRITAVPEGRNAPKRGDRLAPGARRSSMARPGCRIDSALIEPLPVRPEPSTQELGIARNQAPIDGAHGYRLDRIGLNPGEGQHLPDRLPRNPEDGRLAHEPLVIDRSHDPTTVEQRTPAVSVIAQAQHEHTSVLILS